MALIKTTTIETTGNSLTVTITSGPNATYSVITAQVMVSPLTIGVVVPPPQDDGGSPKRTLTFAPLEPGDYAVTVVCSGKTEGALVTIPTNNKATFPLDETNIGFWLGEH
jgi:hypothetical protein